MISLVSTWRRAAATAAVAIAIAGCGSQGAAQIARGPAARPPRTATAATSTTTTAPARSAASAAIPDGDWTTFDYTAERSGVGPADTGITAANLHSLGERKVAVPGTVDASAVELHDVTIDGRARDAAFMTTSYGITFALDLASGKILWRYIPPGVTSLVGSAEITASTPVVDPNRRYVYAESPNGVVHKLTVATGRAVWSTVVTYDPVRQKLPSPLNLSGSSVVAVTDGYYGDTPPYQGHIVLINRASGHVTAAFNTLCSNRAGLIVPSTCSASDSGIWGRSGSVVEPDGNILVATGNAAFNGATNWGDSVLEFSPSLHLLHNWTPANQAQLNADDLDLGSTEPALLPVTNGQHLAVQGGKQGALYLLDLNRLDGTTAGAGPRLGGQLQQLAAPGSTDVFTAPAVWSHDGHDYVFVADDAGTAAYTLGSNDRLTVAWQDGDAGTSPVLAGGLLYVFDPSLGGLIIRNPVTGRQLDALVAASGHWNSPIVVGGRIILPVGDDNNHLSTGEVFIYHLPGR